MKLKLAAFNLCSLFNSVTPKLTPYILQPTHYASNMSQGLSCGGEQVDVDGSIHEHGTSDDEVV